MRKWAAQQGWVEGAHKRWAWVWASKPLEVCLASGTKTSNYIEVKKTGPGWMPVRWASAWTSLGWTTAGGQLVLFWGAGDEVMAAGGEDCGLALLAPAGEDHGFRSERRGSVDRGGSNRRTSSRRTSGGGNGCRDWLCLVLSSHQLWRQRWDFAGPFRRLKWQSSSARCRHKSLDAQTWCRCCNSAGCGYGNL